ncbi:MAG: hypothetical protein IPN46_12800 [Saprospiraceae bacterium]|nr:hypothetical protein [Saprospiraceae bacterium]
MENDFFQSKNYSANRRKPASASEIIAGANPRLGQRYYLLSADDHMGKGLVQGATQYDL